VFVIFNNTSSLWSANSLFNELNIEPLTQGELMGIPDDVFLKKSGFDSDISSIYYSQGGSSTGTYGGVDTGSRNIDPPS